MHNRPLRRAAIGASVLGRPERSTGLNNLNSLSGETIQSIGHVDPTIPRATGQHPAFRLGKIWKADCLDTYKVVCCLLFALQYCMRKPEKGRQMSYNLRYCILPHRLANKGCRSHYRRCPPLKLSFPTILPSWSRYTACTQAYDA
jgi:hypothetical protein